MKAPVPAPPTIGSLIATARNDITIPHFTTVLRPTDATLLARGGGRGLQLYDEVERDPIARTVLAKRKLALVSRPLVIEPARSKRADARAVKLIEEALSHLAIDQISMDLLDATLKGYAVSEVVWTRDGDLVRPERVVSHDPRRFVFGPDWRPRLLTREAPSEGVELPERKFIVHRCGARGNDPYGLGLGSTLFWPVLFKREGVAFWATALEKYGSPTPFAKYPMGTLPADQQRLLDTLGAMVQAGAIVVPIGSEVGFLEAARAGEAGFEAWCRYWDEQITIAVLGASLSTSIQGQGSRAAAETHAGVQAEIVDADADLLADTLSESLCRWILDFNGMAEVPSPWPARPRPSNEVAAEDLRAKRAANAKAEIDLLFSTLGRLPAGRSAAIAGQLVAAGMLPPVAPDILAGLAPAIDEMRAIPAWRPPTAAFAEAHDHGIGRIVDDLSVVADEAIGAWIGRLRREIDAAEDLDALKARLFAASPDIEVDALGRVMGNAFALAAFTGMTDVEDEIADE